jgi:hypothetical protein
MQPKRTLLTCVQALAALALSTALDAQTLNTLYTFGNGLGGWPVGSVVVDSDGGIYGTTARGGGSGFGVAYELVPPASQGDAWTQKVLHSFGAQDGEPSAGLLMGPSGVLYGRHLLR